MKSVVLVETPLQMINAIEASIALNLSNSLRAIIITSHQFPYEVFRPLLAFTKWERIELFPIVHHRPHLNLNFLGSATSELLNEYIKECRQTIKKLSFDRLAKSLGSVDILILGNYYSPYMRHFANKLRPRNLYLVDDGTDTLRVSDLRREQAIPSRIQQPTLISKFKCNIRAKLVDWDDRQADSVTFFSSYNFELKAGDRFERNEYTFLKKLLAHSNVINEVYFLGQPLVEDAYLSKEDYLAYISRIVQYYRGRKLTYITHKRESPQMINSIRKLGVTVRTFNLPIEVQILQNGIPLEMASFFCSALVNCQLIFGDNLSIKSFRIDQNSFLAGCDFVQDIYDYFCKNSGPNFEILPL